MPYPQANLARVGASLPHDWWFLDTYLLARDTRAPEEVLKQARSPALTVTSWH